MVASGPDQGHASWACVPAPAPPLGGNLGADGLECAAGDVGGVSGMTSRVLLLSPSRGLGGGIERYVQALEWAFAAEGVACQRLDLSGSGNRAHAGLLSRGRTVLRTESGPVRLVVVHRALLPVAALLARNPAVCGMSVVCHGSDMWGSRWRLRRNLERHLMRRANVRVVAVSNFTSGAILRDCRATVLPPALSREWFDTLTAAAASRKARGHGIGLVSAFRLTDWRGKGLPQVVAAVAALGRSDVSLTVCGSGDPPAGLLRLVSEYPGVRCAQPLVTATSLTSWPPRTCSCWPPRLGVVAAPSARASALSCSRHRPRAHR